MSSRFLQAHLLTCYPPANLNRDDLGRPKTAQFGGRERLRISSQCLKRSWRTSEVFFETFHGQAGYRTKMIGRLAFDALTHGATIDHVVQAYEEDEDVPGGDREPVEAEEAGPFAEAIANQFGAVQTREDQDYELNTEQIVMVGPEELDAIDALCQQLAEGKIEDLDDAEETQLLRKRQSAVDMALFGRMLADDPDYNVEAAAQVAHAITTHPVRVENDFFSAVDDLQRRSSEEGAGSGHLGSKEFGAGVFYEYFNVNTELLKDNLGGRDGLAKKAVPALLEAAVTVSPPGMNTTFGSTAYASFVRLEATDQQPRTLVSAFLEGVGNGEDYLEASMQRLEETARSFDQAYGSVHDTYTFNVPDGEGDLEGLKAFGREQV